MVTSIAFAMMMNFIASRPRFVGANNRSLVCPLGCRSKLVKVTISLTVAWSALLALGKLNLGSATLGKRKFEHSLLLTAAVGIS